MESHPTSAADPSPHPAAARVLAELADAYWEFGLAESPIACTYLGLDRGQDRLDERGPVTRARQERALDGLLRRVEDVAPDALSTDDRLTRQILLRSISEQTEAFRHHGHEWDLDQLFGLQIALQDVATKHAVRTPADIDALLSRYAAVPRAFDQWTDDLRAGLASGRTAPRASHDRVAAQLRAFLATPAESTAFFVPARRLPADWPTGDADRARSRLLAAIETHVRPAFAAFSRFLETEYAGKARAEPGVWSIPGGPDAYAFAIRRHTTTTLAAERIHQIGVEELERNEREMLEIARGEGHTGDLRSFLEAVGRDPRYRLSTARRGARTLPDDLRADGRASAGGVRSAASDALRDPRARGMAREGRARGLLPAARRSTAPVAGIFYANTHNPSSWPTYDMETLCYHEAIPGHHLQISIAQKLPGIPEFRRHAQFTAYVEGWAHYTERLADEMGMYSTPMDRLGMLAGQAWRAARLVVDTGMHALKWPRQRAIDVLQRIRSGPSDDVTNEVDRYVIWPGQALAYKIGQRTITEARERAKRRLGAAFDLRAFHDEVLRRGALPLSLFEDLVRSWDGRAPAA